MLLTVVFNTHSRGYQQKAMSILRILNDLEQIMSTFIKKDYFGECECDGNLIHTMMS